MFIPRSFFDGLAAAGGEFRSPIARRFASSQKVSMVELFERACAEGEGRHGLPLRCDRSWFLSTLCSVVADVVEDETVAILGFDCIDPQPAERIWRLVTRVYAYDVLAAVAAVPSLRDRFFSASCCGPQGRHSVIGRSAREHGVRDPAALQAFMVAAMEAALR